MKIFNFRLARLLELRTYYEQVEERKVAAVTAKLTKVNRKLDKIELDQKLEISQSEIENELFYLQSRELFINRLRQQKEYLLIEREELKNQLSVTLVSYQEVKRKRMAIEKLRKRNLNIFRGFQLRDQLIDDDEINTKSFWQKTNIPKDRID